MNKLKYYVISFINVTLYSFSKTRLLSDEIKIEHQHDHANPGCAICKVLPFFYRLDCNNASSN